MCGPLAIPIAAAIAAQAGQIAAGYAQYKQGKMARDAGRYNAEVDRQNALATEARIPGVNLQGEARADAIRRDVAREKGQAASAFAGGNVDLSSSTAQFAEIGIAQSGASDIAINRYNTAQEVAGIQNDARNYRNKANMDEYAGEAAFSTGRMAFAMSFLPSSSALSSISSVGSSK